MTLFKWGLLASCGYEVVLLDQNRQHIYFEVIRRGILRKKSILFVRVATRVLFELCSHGQEFVVCTRMDSSIPFFFFVDFRDHS